MRKIKRQIKSVLSLVLAVLLICVSATPPVMAAADCSLAIKNLEIGDLVEIYRIATHEEGKFVWESELINWIATNEEGRAYAGLTPEQFVQMTPDRSEEFCQSFLVSCKDEANGIAKLEGYSFTVTEEKEEYSANGMTPGYYIVLPKGKSRIYRIKWAVINPAETVSLIYDEATGDYQLPTIESETANTTVQDREIVWENDEIEIKAGINVPTYPNMYATGKRILNATVVVPKGLKYVEDSLSAEADGELEYSMGEYNGATIYQNKKGEILFFQTEDNYFYELSGEQLASEGEPEAIVEKYNQKYKTEYELIKKENKVIEDAPQEKSESTEATENIEETESLEGTESIENTEKQEEDGEEMSYLGKEDDRYQIEVFDQMKLFVFSIDTKKALSKIDIRYRALKDDKVNSTCFFDNIVSLSYSVSPLDANLICNLTSVARVKSYGIRITLCEGTGASIDMTAEEKLEKSARLTGAKFDLYKFSNVYEGDVTTPEDNKDQNSENQTEEKNNEDVNSTETTENSEEETRRKVELVYMEEIDKTYEFTFCKELIVDSNGEATIGGIDATAYLITESVYPSGHTLSEASFLIEADAWTDENEMDGNCLLDILWLNYKTVYLPATGSNGTTLYTILGGTVAFCAIILFLDKNYSRFVTRL